MQHTVSFEATKTCDMCDTTFTSEVVHNIRDAVDISVCPNCEHVQEDYVWDDSFPYDTLADCYD